MLRRTNASLIATLLACLPGLPLGAQDTRFGVTVPLTISGQLLRTERGRAVEPDARTWHPGFRLTAYPGLKLGENWYFYSALELTKEPYSYYETYYPESKFEARWIQAFLGYHWIGERKAFSFRTGQLASAFGAFPLRYDDAVNPLLNQPLSFSALLKIRPDGLPCGTKDLPNLREYGGR